MRRFLFVTGKGGVGKTTVTAALATSLASQGKRVLVAMTGPQERLSRLFESEPIGHDIQRLEKNIWATKIDPARAMEEYGQLVLKVKAVARAVFDNKYTNGFFRAVPGLYEWAMLGKAWYHTTEKQEDGGWRFDVVIMDAPSTGHGLDMLRVPKVLVDVAPPGVLRRDAQAAWDLFRDPARSGVVVVTLAEAMPTREAIELIHTVRDELQLPIAQVVVNAVAVPLFSEAERQQLLADPTLLQQASEEQGDTAHEALSHAARRASYERLQRENMALLRAELKEPPVVLPALLVPDRRIHAEAFGLVMAAPFG